MSPTAFSDALGPLAARMGKVVREREILRVVATVHGEDSTKSAEASRREVLAWAQNRSGGHLPSEAWSFDGFEHFTGGRNCVGVRIQNDENDIWALRADDPDKDVPGRVWTTEVVVGFRGKDRTRFSARLLVSTTEDELDIEPHCPGFVQQVADTCGLARGAYDLTPDPWLIDSEDQADQLADMLVNPLRQLPFFVLTVAEDSRDANRPLLDASGLGRAVLGMGHVAIVPAAFTWTLTNRFGKQRSVFGGAARVYLSGFTEDASPYSHRLVLAENLVTEDGAAQCVRWMRSLAATESLRRARLGDEVLTFSAVKNASIKLRQEKLEKEEATESEQLEAAKARIAALEKQHDEDQSSLNFFASEHEIAEARAEAAEEQQRASAFRIQQLLGQLQERGEDPDANTPLPESWAEFVDWCEVNLAGRVALTPRACRSLRSPQFEDPPLAARCLLWLANDYRDRRIDGGGVDPVDQVVEDGMWNAPCGADQFDADWQGARHTADWHIKNGGNTRDPTRCLRIYYFWDPATRQVIIAEMPAHRPTGAT